MRFSFFLYQIFAIVLLVLSLDFFVGDSFLKSEKDDAREYHDIFGMNLKPNITKTYQFSNSDPPGEPVMFCTDQNAFRFLCNGKNESFNETLHDIIFIGDSIVESTGVSFEDSFSGLFQKKYNKKIINMGVNGYGFENSYTKINFFLNNGLQTKKLFLFVTSVNDFNQFNNEYKIITENKIPKTIILENYNSRKNNNNFKKKLRELFPLTYVNLWKIKSFFFPIEKNIVNNNLENLKNINYVNFEKSNEGLIFLNKFNQLSEEFNFEMYFVIFPTPGQYFLDNTAFIKTMENFCVSKKCKLINLFEDFFSVSDKEDGPNSYKNLFLPNDDHFNIRGHRLVAESVHDKL